LISLSSQSTAEASEPTTFNAAFEPMAQSVLSATSARPGDIAIIGYNTGQNLS
jgi:hypothetical protein